MATLISLFDTDWIESVKPCTASQIKKTPELIERSNDWVIIATGNKIEGIEAIY